MLFLNYRVFQLLALLCREAVVDFTLEALSTGTAHTMVSEQVLPWCALVPTHLFFRILSIIGSATYQYESKNLFAIVNVFALSVWKYIEHGKNLCLLRVFPLCTCLIGEIIERFQFEFKTKRWKALLNFLSFGRRADNDNVACSRSKHVDKVLVQHAMQIIECRSLQRNLARFLHNSGNWLITCIADSKVRLYEAGTCLSTWFTNDCSAARSIVFSRATRLYITALLAPSIADGSISIYARRTVNLFLSLSVQPSQLTCLFTSWSVTDFACANALKVSGDW